MYVWGRTVHSRSWIHDTLKPVGEHMSLDKFIGQEREGTPYRTPPRKKLHIATNPTFNEGTRSILNVLTHVEGDGAEMSDWAVLGVKEVAALHAILTNWLKKRDRRVGPKDRRTSYPHGGRRAITRYRDLPVSLERRGAEPGVVGRRSYMVGRDRRKSTAR
jgi:hypothetical protein